jgi:hypothetical protein
MNEVNPVCGLSSVWLKCSVNNKTKFMKIFRIVSGTERERELTDYMKA